MLSLLIYLFLRLLPPVIQNSLHPKQSFKCVVFISFSISGPTSSCRWSGTGLAFCLTEEGLGFSWVFISVSFMVSLFSNMYGSLANTFLASDWLFPANCIFPIVSFNLVHPIHPEQWYYVCSFGYQDVHFLFVVFVFHIYLNFSPEFYFVLVYVLISVGDFLYPGLF